MPSRPRAYATTDEDEDMSRESTIVSEIEQSLRAHDAANEALASESGSPLLLTVEANTALDTALTVDASEMPILSLRLLGESPPDVVPAAALVLAWRLQYLAISILGLLALSVALAGMSFMRGVQSWQSSAGQTCNSPLRWWLVGHVSILALGMIGCCSGAAFAGLIGWIAWGMSLLATEQAKKCPSGLRNGVKEALTVEYALVGLAMLLTFLAAVAARTARETNHLCHYGFLADEPWEPEEHLEFQEIDSLPHELDYTDRRHGLEEDTNSSHDRECSICYETLTDIGGVIARAACGHRFHRDCILEWLRNHRTCPLCRHRVDKPIGWRQNARQPRMLEQDVVAAAE